MKEKIVILGVIAAIAVLSAVKSFGPQPSSSSCCPGSTPDPKALAPSQSEGKDPAALVPEGKPVWVLAHSDWCAQCQEMSRIASKVAPAFSGKVAFVEVKVDDPAQQAMVQKLKISVIPTSIFLDATGKERDRVLGVIPEKDLKIKLQSLAEAR
ncbi:MAG: hypothetical protein KatS3mg024_2060 [Armatimonadota bacterium]|nr:MAG: hypothetical protein KatS3mg024_2060 [Armatimonadota bacterium]